MKKIYLDYAAATPIDKNVLAAMMPYFTEQFYNPSALYLDSKHVSKMIAAARADVARWLGARTGEIIFTAGGTEANNLAIYGVMSQYPGANMLVSAIEHESVMMPANKFEHHQIRVDVGGVIDLKDVADKVNDSTVLISVMYANNEIGTIQPLSKVAALADAVRKQRRKDGNDLPLYVHTDACQAANYLSLQVSRLGVDMMTLNGGKIYGPKQSGALFVRSSVQLAPLILGGGQERGMRSGTENVPFIIGFAAALNLVQPRKGAESRRLAELQRLFVTLMLEKLPTAVMNGSSKARLVNNVNIMIPGTDNERLVFQLDEAGIQCAAGSACSAQRGEPSHVLRAIGLDDDGIRSSIRFSLGAQTDEEAIRCVIEQLAQTVD